MKKVLQKVNAKWLYYTGNILPKYFTRSQYLSKIYYFLCSRAFSREQHAVLNGKVSHLKEYEKYNSNIYTLIRNTHRIEKGLLMRPRRDVFAVDYIPETLSVFTALWTPDKMQKDRQFKWFYDVLKSFFSTAGDHPVLNENYRIFEEHINSFVGLTKKKTAPSGKPSEPYIRAAGDRPNLSYDEFYKLTRFRRSVRWFLNKTVPRELVDKAVLAAAQSPSACNRQPFQYYIIDDPVLLKEIKNLPNGIRGYSEGIPMMVVVVGNLNAYFDERDRHVVYIDASLANMSFMLALETLGLSSCAINWPDIEIKEKRMESLLKLKSYQRPLMCMAVGYPDPEGKVAYSEKRDINYIRKYN